MGNARSRPGPGRARGSSVRCSMHARHRQAGGPRVPGSKQEPAQVPTHREPTRRHVINTLHLVGVSVRGGGLPEAGEGWAAQSGNPILQLLMGPHTPGMPRQVTRVTYGLASAPSRSFSQPNPHEGAIQEEVLSPAHGSLWNVNPHASSTPGTPFSHSHC